MVVNCEQVWHEISNYIDGDVTAELRDAMDEHIRGCKRCATVLEGTRNVVGIYGDERMLEMPLGFDRRLQRKLQEGIVAPRRTFLGWMVATAAAILLFGGFEIARTTSIVPAIRSALARRGKGIPPDMVVAVEEDGRLFHVPGCRFIHDPNKVRTVVARVAMKDGFSPCTRCLKKYLDNAELSHPDELDKRSTA